MDLFEKKHAEMLRREHKYDELFAYCSSYPSDEDALAFLGICHRCKTNKLFQRAVAVVFSVLMLYFLI